MTVKRLIALIVASVLLNPGFWGQAQTAQSSAGSKPADVKQALAEIAGDYDFEYQGGALSVNFFEQTGKLFGAAPGESPIRRIGHGHDQQIPYGLGRFLNVRAGWFCPTRPA